MNTLKLSLVAGLLFSASLSQATVLNFSGNICGNGSQACSNGGNISQSYGDSANIDVVWDSNLSAAGNQNFFWWSTGYSGQTDIAYNTSGQVGAIDLRPAAGFQVTLNSFDIGAWLSVNRTTQVSIQDANGLIYFSSGSITFNSLQLFNFNGITSANGIRINLGPDAFNTGIDNINFTVSPINVNTVPVPAAAWLFGSALFGLFGLRKHKEV